MLSVMTSDASTRELRPSASGEPASAGAGAGASGSHSHNHNHSHGNSSDSRSNHGGKIIVKNEPPQVAGPALMISSLPSRLPPMMKPNFHAEPEQDPEPEPMDDDAMEYQHPSHPRVIQQQQQLRHNPGLTILTNAPPMNARMATTPPASTGSSFLGENDADLDSGVDEGSDNKSDIATVRAIRYAAKANQRREKRSTKSKCSPGLRSGKWTPEEEAFTNMIIHYFKKGLMNLDDGTSLRWYLAKRLNCEAMRVTKKLKGNSSIGKQIFRALEDTMENQEAIAKAAEELEVLENLFLDSLPPVHAGGSGHHHPKATTHVLSSSVPSTTKHTSNSSSNSSAPGSATSSPSPHHQHHHPRHHPRHHHHASVRRPSPSRRQTASSGALVFHGHDHGHAQDEPVSVAQEDVQLLLHFYVEANDENTNNDKKKTKKKRMFHQLASSTSSSPVKRRGVRIEQLMD